MIKAVVLLSGGLDSTLAAGLMRRLGIDIIALNFKTPFCLCNRGRAVGCGSFSRCAADNLGIELRVMSVTDEFFGILKNPAHGFGSNMNPCIDCRILLFKKAKELMQETGASFIVTGEVLGQRPMSQHKQALRIIEREAGLEGLVLRPLSARLLPETIPEKENWVERSKLLDFNGRTRKPQMALAQAFNIRDYPCAAGGCLLTDPQFAKKIKDLLTYAELNINNVELLKVGRHFRVSKEAKLVVGRDEEENRRLLNLTQKDDYLLRPLDIAGPTALGRGSFNDELIRLCGSIVCRYSDINGRGDAEIVYRRVTEKNPVSTEESSLRTARVTRVSPAIENELLTYRIC